MSSGEYGQADGPGRLLAGRYRVTAQLGRGGMGVVWRAEDEVLGREVAVKELRTYTDADAPELADLRLRMQREARAAARVRHPGVVAVHDVTEVDGRPLIVMELVDGPSLDDVLRDRGTLDPREAAGIGAKVMDALAAAHRAGVLHRDVKPGNILLDRSGRVVLTDFGIATMEDPGDGAATHLTRSGELVGSLDYLAPERAQGAQPGAASDVWALGATLYAAVEGASPFRRTSTFSTLTAIVTDPLPEPRRAGPLGPVLRQLMDKRPESRPDADRARALLQAVADGGPADVPTSPLRGPAPTPFRTETELGVPSVPPGFGPPQGTPPGAGQGYGAAALPGGQAWGQGQAGEGQQAPGAYGPGHAAPYGPQDAGSAGHWAGGHAGQGPQGHAGAMGHPGQGAPGHAGHAAPGRPGHEAPGHAGPATSGPPGYAAPGHAAQGHGPAGPGAGSGAGAVPSGGTSAPTGPVSRSAPRRRKGPALLAAAAVTVVLVATGVAVTVLNDPGDAEAGARTGGPGSSATATPDPDRTRGELSEDPEPSGRGEQEKTREPSRTPDGMGASSPEDKPAAKRPDNSSAGGATGGGAGSDGGTTGGGGTTTAPPACTPIGGGKYNCQVWRTAKSYTAAGAEAGVLNAGTNYFYCQQNLGRRETYGEWTNVWWAKTDDDSGNAGVFVSDVYIQGGDNDAPLPGLPVC
ncbi:serine/threonine-protein kinase [Streptomyces sp. DH24]|uniref:serine/threonine-protein kinase n=1 Tax=Streptomyces sp. DH24 TaxID=3040123 RepID=UPI0024436E13|nr:serine/threonine-protein kinase [Streptomyces sp. DH24]MDG9718333.1 protein kinase [Streptomyces sp. DH24]